VQRRGRSTAKWEEIVTELKNNPNEFAKVGTFSPGVPVHMRNGMYKAFLPADFEGGDDARKTYMQLHWEITTRRAEKHRLDVWVKWLG